MSKVDFTDPAIIERLTLVLAAAGVDGIEITRRDQTVRIVVAGSAGRSARDISASKSETASAAIFKAPMAGVFWPSDLSRAPTQGSSANDNLVGFLRVGPVLLPVKAGTSKRLRRHLVEPGTVVGFGDPIAEVEPEA
ncbi:acetyl-CoA carboxylase [Rhizobium sp. RM]|uniref:acetyl-CoA carboxylase n=1 Tax=Rhizobium sp. RM TaxID=2748079 RepID=UPI00110E28FD|nr:acetyl-CoA carboxylase [Rhizobium sp. RM]NWJ25668.1 acetyl-CoA carboxylase [Rhizobium sp. RM]TMV17261.1 acetyl-CoA carboxylase [Rhizobium sp. Td3]